jgi:hypothetical protein
MKNTTTSCYYKITGGAVLGTLLFSLVLPQAQAVNVLTQHNDQFRSGANTNETILTPANVNPNQFGKLFSLPVDGYVFAQPLYVSGLSIAGGTHNVVYVATMENSVYAYDADNGALLWHTNFNSGAVTPIPIVDATASDSLNIHGDVGIESTPVIDLNTSTIYVEASFKNTNTTTYFQELYALSLTTGGSKFGGPTNIVTSGFNPLMQNQRPGLAEANGNIYICWGSHEDYTPYEGWMMAYNATNLAQKAVFDTVPGGSQSALWMAGQAPAIDSSGNLYVTTGNGDWNGTTQWGETCLKMSPSLSVLDWATPADYATLNANDTDFGSAGCMLLPSSTGYPGTSYVVTGGKEGRIFVLDKNNGMGHYTSGDTGEHQIFQAIQTVACTRHIHGTAVYFNSATNGQLIYVWGENDVGKSFKFNGSTFTTNPFTETPETAPTTGCGMPGCILAVSANGNANGIVWANSIFSGDGLHDIVPGILRAYDANNLGTELWNSYQNKAHDDFGSLAKYVPPTIANGKVYMASFSHTVDVYGLLNSASIILANYSFETNSSGGAASPPKTTNGFGAAAGWQNAGSTYANSGVDYAGDVGITAEQGSVVAYCEGGDPGAYQISGYKMRGGDTLTLTWWAKASAGAAGQTVSIMSAPSPTSAFSSLTTLANSKATLNQTGNGGAYTQYSLNYTPTTNDVGNYVAVFFAATAPASTWATFDNFALSVQYNPLVNGSFETNSSGSAASPPKTTTGFTAAAGWLDAGSTYVNSGLDYAGDNGNVAEDGSVLAYAKTGDSGAYQISDYQMQLGDPLTLTWWAKSSAGAAGQTVSLMSASNSTTAFSSLTTLATSTATLNQTGVGGAFTLYSLNYTPTTNDVGKYAAVFFAASATPTNAWASFDNFALTPQYNTMPMVTNGIYNLVNLNSGLALDVAHASTTNGSPVDQWTINGGANQEWAVTNVGGYYYEIIGVQSGLALDVFGDSDAPGTEIDIYTYDVGQNQWWSFTPTSGGYYEVSPANAVNSCLDVVGGSTTPGAAIDLWPYTGGANQQWKLQAP